MSGVNRTATSRTAANGRLAGITTVDMCREIH